MIGQMRYSQTGLHLTEDMEGDKLKAYPDSTGIPTIGYGHTLGVHLGMTCTEAEAALWLRQDIGFAEAEVNRVVRVPLTQPEFDALVDFTFNCGRGNFDHSTLLALVNKGDMAHAAAQFDRWDKAGGKVVAGLLRRRKLEAAEFLSK